MTTTVAPKRQRRSKRSTCKKRWAGFTQDLHGDTTASPRSCGSQDSPSAACLLLPAIAGFKCVLQGPAATWILGKGGTASGAVAISAGCHRSYSYHAIVGGIAAATYVQARRDEPATPGLWKNVFKKLAGTLIFFYLEENSTNKSDELASPKSLVM